ncbi:MAG: hypothetical protein K8R02_06155 [Anaerohalosphaeraceae bacterium]|nr:hypothetical protein [Anaerohalosphaeraceae bacterium]
MGFRSKVVFVMIVYFAGFATAIYYVAPSGAKANYQEQYQGGYNLKERPAKSGVMDKLFEKTYSKASGTFAGMSSEEVKEKFNLGFQKLIEMSRRNPKQE